MSEWTPCAPGDLALIHYDLMRCEFAVVAETDLAGCATLLHARSGPIIRPDDRPRLSVVPQYALKGVPPERVVLGAARATESLPAGRMTNAAQARAWLLRFLSACEEGLEHGGVVEAPYSSQDRWALVTQEYIRLDRENLEARLGRNKGRTARESA